MPRLHSKPKHKHHIASVGGQPMSQSLQQSILNQGLSMHKTFQIPFFNLYYLGWSENRGTSPISEKLSGEKSFCRWVAVFSVLVFLRTEAIALFSSSAILKTEAVALYQKNWQVRSPLCRWVTVFSDLGCLRIEAVAPFRHRFLDHRSIYFR